MSRSFTMLEMLLVIALVALTLGALGMQIPKALRAETFEKGISALKGKLALAQEVMLDYDAEVTLELTQEERGVRAHLDAPLSASLLAKLNRHSAISGIEDMIWEGVPTDHLTLVYQHGKTPRGELALRGAKERTLWLPGYPAQIGNQGDRHVEKAFLPSL